jgi:biotin carboxylase
MKKFYAKGGIRTARQIKASQGLEAALNFAEDAGYPLFSKPDIGVGAGGAHKLESEEQLRRFFETTPQVEQYVIEEYVTGNICTYDAIVNSQGDPLFESMCVCPPSIADVVEYNLDSTYYVEQHMSENLRYWGRKTVKAFEVQSRFVHLEFFRLDRPHRGLGEVGDFVALEVNMRPGGGFTPDMINYAHSVDVYKIWADMVCFDKNTTPYPNDDYYVMFAGRRDNVKYVHSHEDIMKKYKDQLRQWDRLPKVLSGAMGDQTYIARFKTKEEMDEFYNYTTSRV